MSVNANDYGNSLPPMYSKAVKPKTDPKSDLKPKRRFKSRRVKAAEALAKRQRELHDRVALLMTDCQVPGLPEEGFTAFLASTEAADKPVDDKIVQLALKTVYPIKATRANSSSSYSGGYGSYFGMSWSMGSEDEYQPVVKRTPVEFLARHYGFEDVAQDQQIESIAEKLETLKAEFEAKKLRNIYALCRASNDDFAGVVGEIVDAAKGTRRKPDEIEWSAALSTVVEVWKERKLQADISPFLINFAGRKPSNNYGYSSHNGIPYRDDGDLELLKEYLEQFAEISDLSKVKDFMAELRLKMIGSEEEQRELSKLLVKKSSATRKDRDKMMMAGSYAILSRNLSSRKTFWLGVKEGQRFTFPNQDNSDLSSEILDVMSEFKPEETGSLLKWLRQSSFLTELNDFDPYLISEEGEPDSVWGSVLDSLKYNYSFKEPVVKQLSKKKDLTFGEKLLLAYSDGKPANIYQMLGSKLEVFSALPEEQQSRLARFASEVNTINIDRFGSRKVMKLPSSKESKAAKQKCLRLLNTSVKSEVVKLMEAKRFKDIGVDAYEFEDWCDNVLASMSLAEPQEILAAVTKISKLTAANREVAERTSGQEMPFKSRLVESVIAKNVSTDSVKLMLAALEKEDDFQGVNFSEGLSKSMGGFFRSQFTSTKTALKKQDKSLSSPAGSVEAMKQMINQFGDEYGDRDLNTFIPELRAVCMPILKAEAKAVDTWLNSDETTKYPKIKDSFRLAFDCSRDILEQRKFEKKNTLPPARPTETKSYLKEILNYIGDDSVALQARSRVAVHLVHYNALSCEGVITCCRVLAQAYDAGQAFEGLQNERIFQALINSKNDPGIDETKVTFAKSWARSLEKRRRSFRQFNVVYCLEMLHLSGDKAQVIKLLDALNINRSPRVAVTLVELGYFAEAEKQCETIWSGIDFLSTQQIGPAIYSSKLEAKLPAFLERFNDPGNKYFAELYFASLRNPEVGDIKTTPESRMSALAEQFSSIKFKSKRERQLSLILLSMSNANPELIDLPLTEETKDISLESIFTSTNPELKVRLLGSYNSTQIQLQNFEPVQASWKEFNRLLATDYSGTLSWGNRKTVKDLALITYSSFFRLLRDRTPEQVAELLPVLRDFNNPSYSQPLNPLTFQMAFLMAGRIDELATFRKEQDEYFKENGGTQPLRTSSMNEFIAQLNVQYARTKPTNPAVRANFAANVWRFGKQQKYNFGTKAFKSGSLGPYHGETRYGIEQFAQLGMLTEKEILEVGPSLAEIFSVNGEIWVQLGRRQFKAGQYEKAAESYRKSLNDAKEDMKKAKFNRRVEYANTLVKLKRNEEAKKMIENIPAQQLFNINKPVFKEIKKKLNEE